MKGEVETLIANALRLDPTIKPEDAEVAMRVLKGESFVPAASVATSNWRVISRAELARRFRVSPKTISNWAKSGRLSRVPNKRGQSLGYTIESAEAIYRGER